MAWPPPAPPLRTLRRALVVLVAYGLSAVGLLFTALGTWGFLSNDPRLAVKLFPLVWFSAWVAHVRMSVAWVRHRPVSRRWPVGGSVAGVLSLASPVFLAVGEHPASPAHSAWNALTASAVVAASLLPCIALAVYVVRFHWRADVATRGQTPSAARRMF